MDDFEKMVNKTPMEIDTGKMFLHFIYASAEISNYLRSILKVQLEIKHLIQNGNYDLDIAHEELDVKMQGISEQTLKQYNELIASFVKS